MPTKFIFVTGGVVSSIGKGICVASIGRILKSRGLSVSVMKLDPYLNVDPGTMSPYQHGEVFVTHDGGETDLDLGHYERFIDIELTRSSNLTAGQVYLSLIAKERKGDYLGGTIQTVPHVTSEIKVKIIALAEETQVDVVVVEVGGTVGDIEGLPFLEAIRQIRNDVGRNNVFYVHVTLLPYLAAAKELKTKPTQHSVKELRSIGIQPDAIICRSDYPVPDSIRDKISSFCDVPGNAVIPLTTVDNVYEVPLILEEAGLGEILLRELEISALPRDMADWAAMVDRMKGLTETVTIALVGKYVEYPDSYISVKEALRHAGLAHGREVEIQWVHSEDIERLGPESLLSSACGIVVPGGFGPRGVEGMVETVRYAREHQVPYLGLCLGLQVMVIEWARNVLGLAGANSSELDPDTPHPVIHIMESQRAVTSMGGTMRLGAYPCLPQEDTWTMAAYKTHQVTERHRHRFELNNTYREVLQNSGLVVGGISPDGNLVETGEVSGHPFMVGVQFHPEFLSRPTRPHPLFAEFVGAAGKTIREGGQRPLPLDSGN
ncbi:MAG: CTP synthase [Dehalococcoidia bacterium]|jgi:CTP synthase|nr:CTP synthase [Dehalococcoidia bacterium]MDP7084916.1 CTP synthase [Dehalococcoidia bacterium]MDP7199638.1 CTP synthase [Dehalococcoidia bacterium]MDP7509538.1 CTP synthase [Dehalococcoidia bacterium]HJN88466.1 CTP synthase [Dehalococcoidia bacterium]